MGYHLRIARPVMDLARAINIYSKGLGLRELGSFSGHAGFNGAMLRIPKEILA